MVSYGSMSFFFVIWIVLSAINQQRNFSDKNLGRAIIAMIYLYQGCYHFFTPIALTYIMEILPYGLRGKGSALYQILQIYLIIMLMLLLWKLLLGNIILFGVFG